MRFIGIILIVLLVAGVIGIFIVSGMKNMPPKVSANNISAPEVIKDTKSIFNAQTPAPELTGITAWINPDKPFTLKSLQGKVVLLDFWTNQCINCIHALPYVTRWYDTYKDQGFVVVGVHTPELAYEQTISSIQSAIQTYGIHYPVVQDNNYATWNAYNNQYWPAEYLIDKKGIIRRTYFGEGEYDKTEEAIKTLLKE
jgi:thiol-disulfide isomerase/thioredoxin